MHPGRTAYSSAYLRWHQLIGAGAVSPYRPADGSARPFAAPGHLRGVDPAAEREFDVVLAADWRFLESAQRTAVDELRALAAAGWSVAVLHLESYRAVHLKRAPLAAPVQDLINDGVVEQIALDDRVRAGLLIVRQAAVLQFTGGMRSRITAGRILVVADRAPARTDGTDRRYLPATCSAAARRLFGADPEWVAQDGGVRASLRTVDAGRTLAAPDWPTVLASPGWVDERAGASRGPIVAGVDLADAANWPPDVAETLAVCRRLAGADIRVRPARPTPRPADRRPAPGLARLRGERPRRPPVPPSARLLSALPARDRGRVLLPAGTRGGGDGLCGDHPGTVRRPVRRRRRLR